MYTEPSTLPNTFANCCRMCGATSYRPVIARDGQGAMRPTALYQCSGCSVVFTDPKAWREGGQEVPAAPLVRPLTPIGRSTERSEMQDERS